MACKRETMSEKYINHQILTCSCPVCHAIKQSFYPIDFYHYPIDQNSGIPSINIPVKILPENKSSNSPMVTDYANRSSAWISDEEAVFLQYATHPIYEFRGVWVTTVRNSDFPNKAVFEDGTFDLELFKREFFSILKHCKLLNLNAIFFQVRPQGDAFYESKINPWSEFLSGQQGVRPDWGDFDPLEWMITMTHGAGLEFHAWFNPYRLSSISKEGNSKEELLNRLAPNHFAKKNPQYVYFFDGQIFLDPGFPQVQKHVIQSVMEVVQNYSIDAVHFDDYFYPYSYLTIIDGEPKEISFNDESPDIETYETYHQPGQSIKQWREYNVNSLIYSLSLSIRKYNRETGKSIAFGVSPFGVWASNFEQSVGSKTSPYQLSSLDEYVNSKLWVDEEWVDYLIPQNYWSFHDPLSPFGEVANWWNEVVKSSRTQLYMGIGLYLYLEDNQNPSWQEAREVSNQIKYTRVLSNVEGFALFTYRNLVMRPQSNVAGQQVLNVALEYLSLDVLKYKSLIPPRTWLQTKAIHPVSGLQVRRCEDDNCLVFYDQLDNDSQYYVIYRCEGAVENFDFNEAANILDVIGRNYGEAMQHYTDIEIDENQTYTYAVTALSQAQVQSLAVAYVFMP
ncbi:family 10 glycosylhydrolase [Turicibacter sanguinis]|nr:putative lipoprotein [Turicibacter sp. HGF1]MTO08816.1 family 10 glycosylhydrolase [Turicibacter sanguinis]MTP46391.1 family 10 glycosylhydrolase [Turicibacter sanguinis]MTP49072.1 family 10 glycosylhydrolase [Turicibacter sanguinis]MTQ06335.1 family 10 glycosylhydrolase [Turicibacter sanguinis]